MYLMTVPNLLSTSRIAIGLFIAFSLNTIPIIWLLLIFVVAVLSDIFDGRLARNQTQVSPIGTLVDHSSDAIFVTSIISRFAFDGLVPWLLPILIAVSFFQYTLDHRLLHLPSFRASRLGRFNGIAYYVFSGAGILLATVTQFSPLGDVFYCIAVVLIITTLSSMVERAYFVFQR